MMKLKTRKPRNPLHDHPLLRKGGAHGRSKKAERRCEKQALRKAWVSLSACLVLSEAHAYQKRISAPLNLASCYILLFGFNEARSGQVQDVRAQEQPLPVFVRNRRIFTQHKEVPAFFAPQALESRNYSKLSQHRRWPLFTATTLAEIR